MEIIETNQKPRKKRILSKTKTAIAKRKLAKKKPVPKKKKKIKPYEYNGKFLPYLRAKKVVKVLELKSRTDYIQWHEKYNPDYLPKRPDNAYKKEFEGWQLFLCKPSNGISKRILDERRLAKERKRKEKERDKETKKVKQHLTAIVKHEMKLAQTKADRLKRREYIALSKHKKDKKKIQKRLDTPVIEPSIIRKVPKKTKYINYDEARNIIIHEKFSNIKEYIAWWDINKPAGIPKRPDRVYENFKWSEYLNKEYDDKFKKKNYREMYRTYEEAVRYVRPLNISNAKQWDDYYKTGKCPKDIPRFPHLIYQYRTDDHEWGKWYSWDEWLGKNANYMIDAFREKQKTLIVIIPTGAPSGIYSFIYKNGTDDEIENFINENELYVIRMYKIETYDWTGYLMKRYNSYNGQQNTFIISNINQVLYDLDDYMTRIL